MYGKNIIINLERTTVGTVDVSKQHQRGFEVMALFAAVLAKYVITHYTVFEHLTKFAGPVKSEKVHSDNINTLQKNHLGRDTERKSMEKILFSLMIWKVFRRNMLYQRETIG